MVLALEYVYLHIDSIIQRHASLAVCNVVRGVILSQSSVRAQVENIMSCGFPDVTDLKIIFVATFVDIAFKL